MIKNIKFIIFMTIMIALFCLYSIYKYRDSQLLNLPNGEKVYSIDSPNNKHSLNMYIIDGGSISSDAIRGEIVNNQNGKKYNIYWGYKEKIEEVLWINNDYVKINGIKLNIHKDKYDSQK